MRSIKCDLRGTVQGVGFRPWVYRLAYQFDLKGFVRNTSQGACIEVEGQERQVEDFIQQIRTTPPVHCDITQCLLSDMAPQGFDQFQIVVSEDDHDHSALVLPDIATCDDCLKEVLDPNNRRYLYPFTNCTHCGPRYSIIESLPYDRSNTSMKSFKMCEACRGEYDDPLNRRFHAQPNACPDCGPRLMLWDNQGKIVPSTLSLLQTAVQLIKGGSIVAVKGLGGFHLMVDALNDEAVALLRQRKKRPDKPFALMMRSLMMTEQYCDVDPLEGKLLQSPQAPIVLLRKSDQKLKVARAVSFENPYLGCMLPTMPLQHILLRMLNQPIVATSGNLCDEPLCTHNFEALERLGKIADFILGHDRPIVRHVDDSIVQVICNEASLIRRSRGYAPLPINIAKDSDGFLATGAQQKNTIALGLGTNVIISQHIGDLNNKVACLVFEETISNLKSIYDAPITKVICDSHPDYIASRFARELGKDLLEVQHHHAHVASCMAEHSIAEDVLGICWDGTGFGPDGTIWGGEFLISDGINFRRMAHLQPFPLPGADQAVKEPRRSALGLLYALCDGDWQMFRDLPSVKAFQPHELAIIQKMIQRKINVPLTSSMGRLFDGIASLTGLCHEASFEGQAAMSLEFKILIKMDHRPYKYRLIPSGQKNEDLTIDYSPMLLEIIDDIRSGREVSVIATRFHQTIGELIIDMARRSGQSKVLLTGGCFQNRWLVEYAVNRLKQEGFQPYWHKKIPSNDGGISLGQMYVAARSR